jgi:hypothetical protein
MLTDMIIIITNIIYIHALPESKVSVYFKL